MLLSQLHVTIFGIAIFVNNYWSVNFSCRILHELLFCHYLNGHSRDCEVLLILQTHSLYIDEQWLGSTLTVNVRCSSS